MAQEQQDGQQQESRWHPTRRQLLWTGATVGLVLLTIAVVIGYRYDITLWDWIKLLIVPAVIAGGGLWFNRQQRERELETARQQREREVEIAERRTQDEALQAYLDQMGQLLLDKDRPLRQSKEDDEVRTLARARTLTLLSRLDGARKRSAVQFLYESGLVDTERSIVDLSGADLSRASLSETDLSGANLSGANLFEADVIAADLIAADLSGAHLNGAYLGGAHLSGANLSGANLSGASLSETDLSGTNLRGAWLFAANLSRANLRGADLVGAKFVTNEELDKQAWRTLEGATMPNGQKYEDWLKDKQAQGKDEKNDGSL